MTVVRASETRPNCSACLLLDYGTRLLVVRASETRPNCSLNSVLVITPMGTVVRASETRPNCSVARKAPYVSNGMCCPGLRNPAQLQLEFVKPPRGSAVVVRASETRPNCSAGHVTRIDRKVTVVRASETRPNCSGGDAVDKFKEVGGCPGLRNPAQLQPRSRVTPTSFHEPLSGPQKPGPIAAQEPRPIGTRTYRLSGPQKPGPIAAGARRWHVAGPAQGCPGLRNPAQLQPGGPRSPSGPGARLSGPQKPGPIAASTVAVGMAARSAVVRASETRPNCSDSATTRASKRKMSCPGLRNPAQLQRADVVPRENPANVVRASETRPNCSRGPRPPRTPQSSRCPGLRNPAQLQRTRRRGRGREHYRLSGPQKPGPIAASPTSPTPTRTRSVVRASETRPNCSAPIGISV